jgi:hypothetical protein
VSPLERRCRWLLRAYPAAYRAERADEMLDTLLERASPGQQWPGVREAASLISGGIRARAAKNADLPEAATIRLAAMLTCAVYLSLSLGSSTGFLIDRIRYGNVQAHTWMQAAICAGFFGATLLIWFARSRVAVLVLLAVSAISFSVVLHARPLLLTAVALALLSALGAERPPASWLWWVWTPVASWLPWSGGTGAVVHMVVLAAFLITPLIWVLTDARPAFALAIVLSYFALSRQAGPPGSVLGGQEAVLLSISAVAVMPMLLRTVRRRRTAL